MKVKDFTRVFVDTMFQKIEVYDLSKGKVVFSDRMCDLPDSLLELELESVDCVTKDSDFISVNVYTEEPK